MQGGNSGAQGKPHAAAALLPCTGFIYHIKRLGNAGQFLRRNAAAGILYADGQPGGCFVQQHFHFAIRRGGFAGILDQVVQHIAQQFRLGQHHGTLLTSKHENSIAYDTNLRYIASTNQDCTVLIIVDAVSRKYFTSETSWLWDIDFDQLNVPHVKRVILSGMYRNDLAERFRFTGVQNWEVIPGIPDAAAAIRDSGSEALYVVTCFSDRDKLLNLPDVKKEG